MARITDGWRLGILRRLGWNGGYELDQPGECKLVFPAWEWALRWMKEPEFEVKRAAFGQAVARLEQGASAAATTLLKTMIDPGTPASVRVRAVRRARQTTGSYRF
jgi:hypothetical protein